MSALTPEQIQQARVLAREVLATDRIYVSQRGQDLARAVLALTEQQPESACPCDACTWLHGPPTTEQQPEPVDEDELITRIRQVVLRAGLGSRAPARAVSITLDALKELGYTIARKQPEGAEHE